MGLKRYDIINLLIQKYNLSSYLEIGCFQKECFNKIECELKHCVDPNFEADYQMTSDKFFKNRRDTLTYHPYNVIFIDGMHTSSQVYSDIINSCKTLYNLGFIVVHDVNPATEWHTRPSTDYKRGEEWNGTTYQGFIRFKQENPHLNIFTIDCDYGVGIITERFNTDVKDVTWEEFDANRAELLGLKSVEEFKKLV